MFIDDIEVLLLLPLIPLKTNKIVVFMIEGILNRSSFRREAAS